MRRRVASPERGASRGEDGKDWVKDKAAAAQDYVRDQGEELRDRVRDVLR